MTPSTKKPPTLAGAIGGGASESMHDMAHEYAERGVRVFPVHWIAAGGRCSCNKADCGSPGKHPLTRDGFKSATLDHATISQWWSRWPLANIAAPTGRISGCWVLDIDPDKGGEDSLVALQHEYGALPRTVEALSGGGGRHFYFFSSCDVPNRTAIRPGIDVRGDGGYIMLPPSNHASGRAYRWVRHYETCKLTDAPDWILNLVLRIAVV